MLGESLGEDDIEKFIIQPNQGPMTVMTGYAIGEWPVRDSTRRVPEYDREDCVPNILPLTERGDRKDSVGLGRSRSVTRRAREVLGLDSEGSRQQEALKVYVGRERSVAETLVRSPTIAGGTTNRRAVVDEELGPLTPSSAGVSLKTVESVGEDEDEYLRKLRRGQLAKVGLVSSPLFPHYKAQCWRFNADHTSCTKC